jgi:hypothetical protein
VTRQPPSRRSPARASSARADGYRPICDAFWSWGYLLGFRPIEEVRLLMAGARRLDSGHLQVERVRSGIEHMAPEGSIAFREDLHEIVGDAERALGKIKGKASSDAAQAWEHAALIADREFTDGNDSLGIDAETTKLCVAARDYLLGAWTELVASARASAS